METDSYRTQSEQETIDLGRTFASRLRVGDIVALDGTLGAGKTEFVKGVCEHFAVEELVTSPTFSIINQYFGNDAEGDAVKIYHLDLYRIEFQKQLEEIGFEECINAPDAIKLVEWPTKASVAMPSKRYTVAFETNDDDENVRIITITAP